MAPKLHVDWGLQEAVNAMNGLLMIHPWHIATASGHELCADHHAAATAFATFLVAGCRC